MNEALQTLEVKVENNGTTPQGKIFAREWNVLAEAVKALDLKEFDEAKLLQFLRDNDFITSEDIPDVDFSNVVTLSGQQTIPGAKDFVGGLSVNSVPIVYDPIKKAWEFKGDFVVTGAITMFGSLSGFQPSTVTEAVEVDGETIVKTKNSQGQWQLTAIGGGGGTGGGISAAEVNILIENALKPYALSTSIPTDNKQLSNGAGYATVSDLDTRINNLINGAPAAYDTLKEISDVLAGNVNSIGDILTALDTKATKTYVDGELAKYILKDTAQDISALHNFVNGLQIGGLPITKSASANNTIYLDANLVVSGAITMFGSGSTTFPTIWANIPFNPEHLSWDGSQWNIKGGGGSGSLDTNAVNVLISEYLAKNSYATISDISSALVGYATQSWVGDNYLSKSGGTISFGNSNSLLTVKSTGGIWTGIKYESATEGGYIGVHQGKPVYIPQDMSVIKNIVLSDNIKSTLGISDWALAETKPTYTAAEVGALSTSGGTITTDSLDGFTIYRNNGVYSVVHFFNTQDGNKKDVGYLGVASDGRPVYINSGGGVMDLIHTGNIGSYNAGSATKLATPRTIWGQSFDGTGNVDGQLDINGLGTLHRDDSALWLNYGGANNNQSLRVCGYDIAFYYGIGSNFTRAITITNSGDVAIGGTTADAKLHVHGNSRYEGYLYTIDSFVNTIARDYSGQWARGVEWIGIGDTINASIAAYGNNSIIEYINITANGDFSNLGIRIYNSGLITLGGDTTINGNLLTTGVVTMFSQASMKNIINREGLSLEQLATIQPARFTWKDSRDTLIHAGGIADEVMQVLPEVVYRTKDDKLTMDYGSAGFFMAASLIKPVIDHEKRIKELEREVKYLREENRQLRAS